MKLVYKSVKIRGDCLNIILGDGGILRQLAENRLIFKLSARQLAKSVRQSRNLRNGNGRILFDISVSGNGRLRNSRLTYTCIRPLES